MTPHQVLARKGVGIDKNLLVRMKLRPRGPGWGRSGCVPPDILRVTNIGNLLILTPALYQYYSGLPIKAHG